MIDIVETHLDHLKHSKFNNPVSCKSKVVGLVVGLYYDKER